MLGFLFRTVSPKRFTASGNVGSATLTLFCTSSVAILISVPTSKFTVILLCPLLVLLLLIYVMPGVPFTCVSIAVVVVCSTVCASAPVKLPDIETVGGEISGYCATGRLINEINAYQYDHNRDHYRGNWSFYKSICYHFFFLFVIISLRVLPRCRFL